MASVSNLKINFQSGSNNSYYASWTFENSSGSASSGSIKKGSLVTIKSGATWYNGVAISSWVFGHKWIVVQVNGDKAVLGKNLSGSNNINSPINVKYLVNVGGGRSLSYNLARSMRARPDTLENYKVEWYYDSGDNVWFSGSSTTSTIENSVYSAPSNALRIKVEVTPVSKMHEVNGKEVPYWTGSPVSAEYMMVTSPPETPSSPTVTIEEYKLKAEITNISDGRCDQLAFEVYKGDEMFTAGFAPVLNRRATYQITIAAGYDYRVRCAAINLYGGGRLYSEWSDFSDSAGTIPSAPSRITRCKANSRTSVLLGWPKVFNAKTYDLEYTTKREYFDTSDSTTVVNGIESNRYERTGLETGHEYFFRVRAVNDNGESGWSDISSCSIGKKPAAPTTWSSTTTAVTGEPLNLYWVHNAEDGSSQVKAELEIYYNSDKKVHTIVNTTDEDLKDKTSVYSIDTSKYSEGTKIKWRVRTCGVTEEYGDWSIQRTIDIYAPAVADLRVTDYTGNPLGTLTAFPIKITCQGLPATQKPTGYHITVLSNEQYNTIDYKGDKITVASGEEIYSKYFDISESLSTELSAGDIDLRNGVSYTLKCTVAMDSGLTAESSVIFNVNWSETTYHVDASIGIEEDAYTAYISPLCPEDVNGDILLSIYRREFDGRFTELATDIESNSNTWITDPHPALDYARYRIVGRSKTTGAVSYYDPPGYPVNGNSVIIQWDEEWREFNTEEGAAMEQQPWAGSLLSIPYNIDVSDSNNPDVALVKYIGRSHPVTYYGTQLGTTSTWSMDIPKYDKDTLYALRRLQIWMGDVYVREPSGSGYWANIRVQFSQKHCEVTIPVTFSITRVEGGI